MNGAIFPQPALVWLAMDHSLSIRALKENRRPVADTKLCVAPYWNVYDTGSVCLGSMRAPDTSTVASIPQWEQGFYESEFTHGNVGRLTHCCGREKTTARFLQSPLFWARDSPSAGTTPNNNHPIDSFILTGR
jgi:PRTRC genetic system protein B